MQSIKGHIGFIGAQGRAVMSEVFAMQCCASCESAPIAEAPMSRRNDAFTAIYYYRYC